MLAVALLPFGCGISKEARSSEDASRALNVLSRQDRVEIFEEVWKTINDQYYDPSFHGVDWRAAHDRYRPRAEAATNDREFYTMFEVMLSELRDAHTSFVRPSPPPSDEAARQPQQSRSMGLRLVEAEGKVVVAEVEPDSDAARGGIKQGMVLRSVNGKPPEEHFAFLLSVMAGGSSARDTKNKLLYALLYGSFLPTPRKLVLEDFEGRAFEVELSPRAATFPPFAIDARRLASGYAYIKFDQWRKPVDEHFTAKLSELMDAPGLIIDLRGNGGGDTTTLLNIASNFFPSATYYGGFRNRAGETEKFFTHKPERVYKGAVVILVDERSASASETFTIFFQESGRATVLGRPTTGATLNQLTKNLPKGTKLRFSYRAYISPNGRNPEGTGVVPDEAIALTIDDLRRQRDAVLEAAETRLKTNSARCGQGLATGRGVETRQGARRRIRRGRDVLGATCRAGAQTRRHELARRAAERPTPPRRAPLALRLAVRREARRKSCLTSPARVLEFPSSPKAPTRAGASPDTRRNNTC